MTDAAALLDALAALDLNDAGAVNTFNLAAFLYVRPFDAPRTGRYIVVGDGLAPKAPDMHRLPDLRARIVVEAMQRGEVV